MEGLTDPLMRRVLTQIAYDLGSPYDWAVSEFIRVTHYPLPAHVFINMSQSYTPKAALPAARLYMYSFLGNNPETMAASALVAVGLGLKPLTLTLVVLPKP